MKLCVIGAGAAGLCAIKHGNDYGCDVTAFEQSDKIGGTWFYTDKVGIDEHGLNIHTSMYQNLRTDIPKEVMTYPNFPYPSEEEKSYLPSKKVLEYLNSYADAFKVRDTIKFLHQVLRVRPLFDNRWEVIVKNLTNGSYETFIFDAVLVCIGMFHTPSWPVFEGQDVFKGHQIHSHDYRSPEAFKGEKVLLIGAGPSGIDLVKDIAMTAESVTWSKHLKYQLNFVLPENVTEKPDIQNLTETGAVFVDGSSANYSSIVYCTGYKFSLPFLSVDCGVACEENFISPLYKHCLSINRPSIGFIGLPTLVANNQIFDLQVRFCLQFMTKKKKLPSKEKLMEEFKSDEKDRWSRGIPRKRAHMLGFDLHEIYAEDLATIADIDPIKPVVLKIFNKSIYNLISNFNEYREKIFKIIDDENFIEI